MVLNFCPITIGLAVASDIILYGCASFWGYPYGNVVNDIKPANPKSFDEAPNSPPLRSSVALFGS